MVELNRAKDMAREAGLDLVEVAPNSEPPVCRIMDYGKWKYQQRKKEQKAKSNTKASELKEQRLRPKIDDHDLSIKVQRARTFLEDNDKVQFTMLFRGREMAHKDLGLRIMREVAEKLADISKIEAEPRQQGRRMTMVLSPDKAAASAARKVRDEAKAAKAAGQESAPPAALPPADEPAPEQASESTETASASNS